MCCAPLVWCTLSGLMANVSVDIDWIKVRHSNTNSEILSDYLVQIVTVGSKDPQTDAAGAEVTVPNYHFSNYLRGNEVHLYTIAMQ